MTGRLPAFMAWRSGRAATPPARHRPPIFRLRPSLGYALAIATTLLALMSRLALADVLPANSFPFLTFFPAVMFAVLLGGLGPGLLASALSVAAAKFFFIPQAGSFAFGSLADVLALVFFGGVLVLDCVVVHVMTASLGRVRQSRAELLASEARFRALAEATREGVVIHDGGVIVDANDTFWRMHGFASRDAVIGRRILDLIAPEGRQAVTESVSRELTDPYESVGLRPDGSRFPLEIEGRAIEHGGRRMRVAISRDLTRRRAAETALRQSEARFRGLAEALPALVFVTAAEGGNTYTNRRFQDYTGLPPEALLDEGWLRILHPGDRARAMAAWARSVATGAPYQAEYRFRRHDGAWRWFLVRAEPDRDAAGRILRWTGTCTDIDDQRQAEAALAESEERLRTATENARVGLVVVDAEHRYRFANRAYAEILSLPTADIVGQRVADVLAPIYASQIRPKLELAFGGQRVSYELVRPRAGNGPTEGYFAVTYEPGRTAADEPVVVVVITDITERALADRALAEREAQLRSIVETAADGILVADADGCIVSANPAALSLFGYPDAAALLGKGLGMLMPAAEAAAHGGYLAAHRAGGPARAIGVPGRTLMGRRRDGSQFPIDLSVGSFAVGGARFFTGVIRDVSGRVAAEEALRESEARFRAMADNIPQLAWMARPDGHIFWYNRRWFDYTGATPQAMQAWGWRDVQHPDHVGRVVASIQHSWATGEPWEETFPLRGADGKWRWFLSRAEPIRGAEGRIALWFGTHTDVTEARATEDRLRLALEAGGMGTWSWDLLTGRLEWDTRQFELFGQDPGAGQPSLEAVMALVHPADRPGLEAAVDAAVQAGDGVFSHEFRVSLAHGDTRWLRSHGHAVPGPDGRAIRLVGLNLDITDAVAARDLLAREAEQLDRLAEERGRALAASEARLAHASKMEALGRLAGGIAHDFNNVLQAVQGSIILASKRLNGDPEAVRRYLSLASEAAGRGGAVTGRLLSFARRGELIAAPVAPAPLLEGLADLLRPMLGPNITLRVEAATGLPPLLADKGQLEAVLVNLVNNARDAMPQGGDVLLKAEAVSVPGAAPGPLALSPGVYLRLSVIDQGEGMPPEVLTRVTEPFFTTKPKGKGTGLGLAMARGFTEQSGGGLSLESVPGHGTTVSIWLPRLPEQMETPLPANDDEASPHAAPSGTTVLLAEDKPEVRAVLAAQLEDQGYRVLQAEDAAAALALVEAGSRPDALVTDLAMPGSMDGLDLVREARARLPRLPALLVTGHAGDAGPGKLEEAERGGPFALLRKPAAPEALFERLARILRQGGAGSIAAAD